MMNLDAKIYVAGHRGLVGSAIIRELRGAGNRNIILRTRAELDLTNEAAVRGFFAIQRPEYVFLSAAKVGGILANCRYPADFIFQNLSIQTNVIESAYRTGVNRLLFLGSSCIYPENGHPAHAGNRALVGSSRTYEPSLRSRENCRD